MGYHSALHDSDNVQHADPDCPAAAIILLQLLPSAERPSYAGAQVEVLEHTDDRLQVRVAVPTAGSPARRG